MNSVIFVSLLGNVFVSATPGKLPGFFEEDDLKYAQRSRRSGYDQEQGQRSLYGLPPDRIPINQGGERVQINENILEKVASAQYAQAFPPDDHMGYQTHDFDDLDQLQKRLTDTHKTNLNGDEFVVEIFSIEGLRKMKKIENYVLSPLFGYVKWDEFNELIAAEQQQMGGRIMKNWEDDAHMWAGYSRHLLERAEHEKKTKEAIRQQNEQKQQAAAASLKPTRGLEMYWEENRRAAEDNRRRLLDYSGMPPLHYKGDQQENSLQPGRRNTDGLNFDYAQSFKDLEKSLPPYTPLSIERSSSEHQSYLRNGNSQEFPSHAMSPRNNPGKNPGLIPGPGFKAPNSNRFHLRYDDGELPEEMKNNPFTAPAFGANMGFPPNFPKDNTPEPGPGAENSENYNPALRMGGGFPREALGGPNRPGPGSEGDFPDGYRPGGMGMGNMMGGYPGGGMPGGGMPGGGMPGGGMPARGMPGGGMRGGGMRGGDMRGGGMPGGGMPGGGMPGGGMPGGGMPGGGMPGGGMPGGGMPGGGMPGGGMPGGGMMEGYSGGGMPGGLSPEGMNGPPLDPPSEYYDAPEEFHQKKTLPSKFLHAPKGDTGPPGGHGGPPGGYGGNRQGRPGTRPSNDQARAYLIKVAKQKLAELDRTDEQKLQNVTLRMKTTSTVKPLTKEEKLMRLQQYPATADGLARVTDPKTHQNQQYFIEGELYVPIIDESMSRLGWTTESPTTSTTIASIVINEVALRVVMRTLDLNVTTEDDWLVFETVIGTKRAFERECTGEACHSRCRKMGCDTVCVGPNCNALCKGPGCKSMCVGDSCTAKCWGKECEAECANFSCYKATNGANQASKANWDQMYPQYGMGMGGNPQGGPPRGAQGGPPRGAGGRTAPGGPPPDNYGNDYDYE